MKKRVLFIVAAILMTLLSACSKDGTKTQNSSAPTQSAVDSELTGRGDEFIEDYSFPMGATDEISQGVFYYELVALDGEPGEGLTPLEGAKKVEQMLIAMDAFGETGLLEGQCLYIAFDEIMALESAMGHECYIYTVGVGTPEDGYMGDEYTPIYRVVVDYSGTKEATIYDDFSGGQGDVIDYGGQGDVIG